MNITTLIGRLTKDPELKYTHQGTAVCTMTLAVDRKYTSQNGQKEADFIPIVVWQKQAEMTAQYVRKGHQCAVVGRIQTRNYEGNDGKRVYVTEVVAEEVKFLEPKARGGLTDGAQPIAAPSDYPFE
jgi:single-strand DNA-binding protein